MRNRSPNGPTSAHGPPGFPSLHLTGERRRIFGWICLLIFVNQLGFGSIVPVVSLYAKSFGVAATAIGLTVAVYGLARFLINVPAGRLAEPAAGAGPCSPSAGC